MISKVFSVFDVKAGVYSSPVLSINEGTFCRGMQNTLQSDPQMVYNKFPEDYRVCKIGEFDDQTAEVKSCKPEIVCEMNALISS